MWEEGRAVVQGRQSSDRAVTESKEKSMHIDLEGERSPSSVLRLTIGFCSRLRLLYR